MTILHNTKAVALRVVHRALVAAALIILLGLSAACGNGSGGDDDTALPDAAGASPSASSSASSDDAADLDPDDAMLKFAQCMRENGVDMPDPTPGGGVRINGEGLTKQQMEAAQAACQKWMDMAEPKDAGHEMSEEEKQQFLDVAACMRERGYDFPDPTFEGGGVTQQVGKGKGDGQPGPDDPSFQNDMEECSAAAGLEPPGSEGDGSTDEQQG
jgi:hypothetical protein